MKPFFAKAVTERPRRGSRSASSAKARWYGSIIQDPDDGLDYDGHSRLPVSRKQEGYHKKIGDKDFSDVLGPIKGFLRSSVGRNWDKVYSDLAKTLGQGSWPIRHVLTQHVNVATNTYRGVDGRVWYHGARAFSSVPGVVDGSYGCEFYVEPETGILRYHQPKRWRYNVPDPHAGERLDAGGGRHMVMINGNWFIGVYKNQRLDPDVRPREAKIIWPDYCAHDWDSDIFRFTKIKSASKKEIKKVLASRANVLT